MRLKEILHQLPQEAIENLAKNVLSTGIDIHLPHTVLIDELTEILDSSSYLTQQIALRHPPFFEILTLLMNAPGHSLSTECFREQVLIDSERMIALANRTPIFPKPKNYNLYLKILEGAWEEETSINASEANLLKILREELKISLMEHFVIEHHPHLHKYWRTDHAYENERNHLRNAGILFSLGDSYVLSEETVALIRRSWGIELSETQFKRLLDFLSNEDLSLILDNEGLTFSGVAEEKKSRILGNYILPKTALFTIGVERLREVAYKLGCRQSGTKEEVIENILDWLDSDEDLKKQAVIEARKKEENKEIIPEDRVITNEAFTDLLNRLTQEALYDSISHLSTLRKSGTKAEKILRLVDSPFSEATILKQLNNEVLSDLCRRRFQNPYGPKEEKIGRLLKSYQNYVPQPLEYVKTSIDPDQSTNREQITSVDNASSNRWPMNKSLESILPQLESVRSEFPFLTENQQIVVSCVYEFKILTDLELESLLQRFNIPWLLLKAQMDELIGVLKSNSKDVISIRGEGDQNIYEILK
jgi:hypothetical protein